MKVLIKAIINIAASIELSDSEQISEDFAVKVLESLGADLQEMSAGEKEYFKSCITQELSQLGESSLDNNFEYKEFLISFLENFGIEE